MVNMLFYQILAYDIYIYKSSKKSYKNKTLFSMGCSRMRGGKKVLLPKISLSYPTMMKLGTVTPYLKKI